VRVPEGATAAQVAQILHREGVLQWTTGFRLLARLSHLDRKLKPGSYRLRRHMSSLEAIARLYRGDTDYIRVILPEGWRAEQIAQRLQELGVSDEKAFLNYVRSQQWEGYLFPATYHLSRGMSAQAVARLLREEFDRQVLPLYKASGRELDLDKVVTLASIIEREAVLDEEKPIVASVYYNRFARNMRLEADPTVQFALGHWKKGLSYDDLRVDSPYNTYLHSGMPPGPICNPGLKAIRAALYPARTKYLYFVADYKGGHTFHETHTEFLKAKAEAKKELKRQKQELRERSTRNQIQP